jgi:hypothetical protein
MENLKARVSDTTTTFWSWLFPITYLMHIAEEYFMGGGYSEYLYRLRGVHLSPTRFLMAQGIGLLLMIVGILIARRKNFIQMMLLILGAGILFNALTHTITSLSHRSYGPGLITSLLVWLPLGLATLVRYHGNMSRKRYWTAIVIGVGINGLIAIFTLRGGRLV